MKKTHLIAIMAIFAIPLFAQIGNSASALEAEKVPKLPELPEYPVKMDTMSDEEFGKIFFAEIDLARPDMREVKPLVAKGDYTGAIAAWAKVFQQHVAGIHGEKEWDKFYWGPLDTIMDPGTVRMQFEGVVKDFGPAGRMDWHSPRDYEMEVNFMWHPKSIIAGLEQNLNAAAGHGQPTKFSNQALLTRWSEVWRDYSSNNWRIGMQLVKSKAARTEALNRAGLVAPNPRPVRGNRTGGPWIDSIQFGNQLCVGHWLLGNWAEQVFHAQHASPELFAEYVSPRTQAEMAYFFTLWPGVVLSSMPMGSGPLAQFSSRLMAFARLSALLPEFYRNQRLGDLLTQGTSCIMKIGVHPDGSNQTLSYNYATWFKGMAGSLANWVPENQPTPEWWPMIRAQADLDRRWFANLYTPTGGQLLLGKNSYGNRKQMDSETGPKALKEAGIPFPPAYTSIAFPWHGLYITRGGWDSNALYAALSNPRRGADHETEGNTKLHLEAYGRFMLVDSPGGAGWKDYSSSSWSKNTIHVDNLDQARMAYQATKKYYADAYADPLPGRWHTSSFFDFAESTYDQGYGHVEKPVKDRSPVIISDVSHTRQLIFVKEAKLWLVADIMEAPKTATHTYQQLWHFDYTFPREAVLVDAGSLSVCTAEPGKPNLFLYMSAAAGLTFTSRYGEGFEGKDKPILSQVPVGTRGWQNLGSGYDPGEMVPAMEVEASWQGTGRQMLLTALVPSPDANNPVEKVERRNEPGMTGLVLHLKDGTRIEFACALGLDPIRLPKAGVEAREYVLVEKPGEPARGILLGTDAGQKTPASCEFTMDKTQMEVVSPIQVPTAFRWVGAAGHEVPDYGYGAK